MRKYIAEIIGTFALVFCGTGVAGDGNSVWLELTGADGVKDFIKTELELAP